VDITKCVANRTNCYLVETRDWGVTYTDGVHPDANGAIIAGEKLAQVIIDVLGKEYFI
jgi:lysophospholipase L1-like esterase